MRRTIAQIFRRITVPFRKAPFHSDLSRSLDSLQTTLGYRFRDSERLVAALVHRSYAGGANGVGASNERLEFLGDSVLSLVVNNYLFHRFPGKNEGDLTKLKSVIVSRQILALLAKRIHLGDHVLVSENAQRAGVSEIDSVLADALEAVFGAVFLDGGFDAARGCVVRMLPEDLADLVYKEDTINYKSLLQEYIQALHKMPPRYRVHSTAGPDHDKEFVVEVMVKSNVLATGAGKTKKHAEQEAARLAYRRLTNDPEE